MRRIFYLMGFGFTLSALVGCAGPALLGPAGGEFCFLGFLVVLLLGLGFFLIWHTVKNTPTSETTRFTGILNRMNETIQDLDNRVKQLEQSQKEKP